MKRTLLLALATLALVSSCYSTKENEEVATLKLQPGVTTKEEVIEQLGPPRGIRKQGDDRVYVFSFGDLHGTGYGLGGFVMAIFLFESTHTAYDNLEVVIGPDRKVRSFRLAAVPREHPKWISEGD